MAQKDYEAMLSALREVYPLEGCGLLAGRKGKVMQLYPVDNILGSSVAFEMDPRQQLAAMIAFEEVGWELTAIYHSHPQGPQKPSPTDVARAYYPDALHLIVSFESPTHPTARAFSIVDGQVIEVQLRIE